MLRSVAVSRIQRLLQFRSDKSTEIIDELQNAQVFYERRETLPWFLVEEIHSISTTATEERVPIPVDILEFLKEFDDDALWYFNGATGIADADVWTELAKDDIAFLRETYPGSGPPIAYAETGDYFRIFPTPDAAYTLKMLYYRKAALLDTDIENDWLQYYPDVLIGHAGAMIASALGNVAAEVKFEKIEARGQLAMDRATEARKHANKRYIMGGPD